MQLFGILVLIFFIIGGILQQKKSSEEHAATIEISPTPIISPTQQKTLIPTIKTTTPMPTPTAAISQQQRANIQTFLYPGASVVSSDAGSMHLASSDIADTITNWYKSKIKGEGYNSTAFAVTNTNGNILTKLAGAHGQNEIRVEITKKSGDVSTQITVTMHTY